MTQVEKKRHAGNIVTVYVGGNMEHGQLHTRRIVAVGAAADPHS